jgi:hypothetical protein
MPNPASAKTQPAGYSGTPLARKLGLKAGLRVWLERAPNNYWALCEFDPNSVQLLDARAGAFDFGHAFVTTRTTLQAALKHAVKSIVDDGILWISWPKKSSGVVTDLTENTLREMGLPLGLVDIKVCAVDATWSGLKFVRRKELRQESRR